MFKKEFGISLYPEHSSLKDIEKYLELASEIGYKKVFLSLIHLNNEEVKNYKELYVETFKLCKKYNFYIILDVVDLSFEILDSSIEDLSKINELGINCLRLDSPLQPKEVSHATHNEFGIDIQINASNNDNFITNILDFKPVREHLEACHNFYPLVNSAPSEEFFDSSNNKFFNNGIKISAFIGSHNGNRGPQREEVGPLVSCEINRTLSPRVQAKYLLSTEKVSSILFGNAFATKEELESLKDLMTDWNKIIFDLQLEKKITKIEEDILNYNYHFRRGDITDDFVRSTMTRSFFKNDLDVEPRNTKTNYSIGDVCIINKNNKHYQKEVIIILKNDYDKLGDTANFIGNLKEENVLLKFIEPWTEFKFKFKK